MKSYIDTSVLVAYYLPEPLSTVAEELLRSLHPPVVSDLSEIEIQSAISKKRHGGEIDAEAAARAQALYASHLEAGMFARLDLQRSDYRVAADWIRRSPIPLRSLDSLHLALASNHNLRLVTADRRLAQAAQALLVDCLMLELGIHPRLGS